MKCPVVEFHLPCDIGKIVYMHIPCSQSFLNFSKINFFEIMSEITFSSTRNRNLSKSTYSSIPLTVSPKTNLNWIEECKNIMNSLMELSDAKYFKESLKNHLYDKINPNSISLNTIKNKLHNNSYKSFNQFDNDIKQMIRQENKFYNKNKTNNLAKQRNKKMDRIKTQYEILSTPIRTYGLQPKFNNYNIKKYLKERKFDDIPIEIVNDDNDDILNLKNYQKQQILTLQKRVNQQRHAIVLIKRTNNKKLNKIEKELEESHKKNENLIHYMTVMKEKYEILNKKYLKLMCDKNEMMKMSAKELLEIQNLFVNNIQKVNLKLQDIKEKENGCNICMDKCKNALINPCGHMGCFDCLKQLTRCHLCRGHIVNIIKCK